MESEGALANAAVSIGPLTLLVWASGKGGGRRRVPNEAQGGVKAPSVPPEGHGHLRLGVSVHARVGATALVMSPPKRHGAWLWLGSGGTREALPYRSAAFDIR